MTTGELSPELQKYVGRVSGFVEGPDEVNKAMIRHWCEMVKDGSLYKKCEGAANQR